MRIRLVWAALAAVFLVGAAHAVIKASLPLDAFLANSDYILVAKIDPFFAEKPAMILNVTEDVKGKAPYRRLAVNLAVGPKDAEKSFQPQILKRLGQDLDVIVFVTAEDDRHVSYAYTNGTWFHMLGTGTDSVTWRFMNGEPALRGTFKGTTKDLRDLLKDVLAGKKKAPKEDPKEPKGFGPEYTKKSAAAPLDQSFSSRGSLFAVIPTLGVGGPIAILALLFPTIFGGVLVLFRQWVAFITLFSINSTLLILHVLLGPVFPDSWLAEPSVVWPLMVAGSLLCFLWAWRRQVFNVSLGPAAIETPERTENIILAVLSLVMLAMMAFLLWQTDGKIADLNTQLMLVLSIGIWLATLNKAVKSAWRSRSLSVPLSTEGVMIGGVLVASLWFFVGQGKEVTASVYQGRKDSEIDIRFTGKERWKFVTKRSGVFVSTPLVAGDFVYAASAHPFTKSGVLHCLDRRSGELKWKFGELKQVYSSPALADGRIYIGEGFHDDPDCKLFCLDAATGKKIWEFQTEGQVESTAAVALGRVYFGAGNFGFRCADAESGKELWSHPPKGYTGRLLRFCGNPIVAHGNVYVGTGVDRNQTDDKGLTTVLCLDARTGEKKWQRDVTVPCWAAPVIDGNRLYVALGNGDIVADANHYDPAVANKGAVLCLNAETGDIIWETYLPNGVLNEASLDTTRLYVGARDGVCYCLDKQSGNKLWERKLNSPMVGSPALARLGDRVESVLGVSTLGRWVALDPKTGEEQWAYELPKECHFTASPRIFPTRSGREIFIAGCEGGDLTRGKGVVYCLEDRVVER